MKSIRIGLHSLILVIADITGIAGGALAAFCILGVPNQVRLQLPIAVVVSVGCFWAWVFSLRVLRLRRLQLLGFRELGACFVGSLVWAPLVFVPLHYFTQGYLTSVGNLLAMAFYQFPVNAIALYGVSILQSSSASGSTQRRAAPNGRPAAPVDNSKLTEGPPSVS